MYFVSWVHVTWECCARTKEKHQRKKKCLFFSLDFNLFGLVFVVCNFSHTNTKIIGLSVCVSAKAKNSIEFFAWQEKGLWHLNQVLNEFGLH